MSLSVAFLVIALLGGSIIAVLVGLVRPDKVIPSSLKPGLGKVVMIYSLLFLVGICLALIACGDSKYQGASNNARKEREAVEARAEKAHLAEQQARESVEAKNKIAKATDARFMMSIYKYNVIKGDSLYKGNRVAVKGVVDSVGRDQGRPYVLLDTDEIFSYVQFMFNDDDEASLAKLSKGDNVVLEGDCQGKDVRNVIFSKSTILK